MVLDGDDVRKHFPTGYEDSDRLEHILRMAKIAAIAETQGLVAIVACVSPRKEWRERARWMFRESFLIYLPGGRLWAGTEYEEPDDDELRPKLILVPQYQGEF